MACHLLVNKLLPESMLTKTSHHMASLAHNVSNGHLIRNLHISSVLWPLCISCFNTGDVLHKEWCLTTDYHLHQDDPLQVSSLTKTSHIIHRFPYAIKWSLEPCDLEIWRMTLENNDLEICDVLHKEWCLTTDYHLHQDDSIYSQKVSEPFIDKNFTYHSSISICYLGTKSNILFFSRQEWEVDQASKQASKNQEP